MAKKKKSKKSSKSSNSSSGGLISVDPERIRFQHSRIRPHFSGCGRSVTATLDSIRDGILSPHELPVIQVIVGPDENDGKGPWYFSLNNRRLWVLKRCREEGILQPTNNLIQVRVREPKSDNEFKRYSLANCAIDAKFMREKETKIIEVDDDKEEEKIEENGNEKGRGNNFINDKANPDHCVVPIMESMEKLKVDNNQTGIKTYDEKDDENNDKDDEDDNKDEDSKQDSESDEETKRRPVFTNRFCFDDSSEESSDDSSSD
jgi:hypothetical protein